MPIEERSRAFGYLVAAGSVGQTVASIVSVEPNTNRVIDTILSLFLDNLLGGSFILQPFE